MIVPDLLRRCCEYNPERVAVVIDGVGEMTYAGWEKSSNRVARALAARGLEPGQRVALWFTNVDGIPYLVAWQAVHKAGGVAVPLNTRSTVAELRRVLEHSGAVALLHGRGCPLEEEAAADVVIDGDELRAIAAIGDASTFQVPREPDDLADILYTSGTTGTSKGVACTHADITFKGSSSLSAMFRGATLLHAVPLFTFAGTHAMALIGLRGSMTHVVQPRFEPGRFLELIAEREVRLAYAVPAMLLKCLADPRIEGGGFGSLQILMYGTAPMPAPAIERLGGYLPSTFLINLYGLTEGGAAVCSLSPDQAQRRPGSIGKPMPPTELRIVDEDGEPVPAGEPGEIQMRSEFRHRTYWRDDAATAETWTSEGWLKTGDIGRLDDDGYLYLVDRKKDLIIVGGHNVSAPEVEAALIEHPAVLDAALVGVAHPELGEVPRAFVVGSNGSPPPADELQTFLRERLADYKVPRTVTFVDELPRNALGKVLKRVLREEASP